MIQNARRSNIQIKDLSSTNYMQTVNTHSWLQLHQLYWNYLKKLTISNFCQELVRQRQTITQNSDDMRMIIFWESTFVRKNTVGIMHEDKRVLNWASASKSTDEALWKIFRTAIVTPNSLNCLSRGLTTSATKKSLLSRGQNIAAWVRRNLQCVCSPDHQIFLIKRV